LLVISKLTVILYSWILLKVQCILTVSPNFMHKDFCWMVVVVEFNVPPNTLFCSIAKPKTLLHIGQHYIDDGSSSRVGFNVPPNTLFCSIAKPKTLLHIGQHYIDNYSSPVSNIICVPDDNHDIPAKNTMWFILHWARQVLLLRRVLYHSDG